MMNIPTSMSAAYEICVIKFSFSEFLVQNTFVPIIQTYKSE